jgi:hypothetical protein
MRISSFPFIIDPGAGALVPMAASPVPAAASAAVLPPRERERLPGERIRG